MDTKNLDAALSALFRERQKIDQGIKVLQGMYSKEELAFRRKNKIRQILGKPLLRIPKAP